MKLSHKFLKALKKLLTALEWTLFFLFLIVFSFWFLAFYSLSNSFFIEKLPAVYIQYIFLFLISFVWFVMLIFLTFRLVYMASLADPTTDTEKLLQNRVLYIFHLLEAFLLQFFLYLLFLYNDWDFSCFFKTSFVIISIAYVIIWFVFLNFSKAKIKDL
ncbi:hypothetical protein [Capnocytophaga sp.]|uniref:hypothetical protein n=1 Tax=Capnocytophaga sp. TaxID=44737 RepID=UPI0026DD5C65|nr:hypothetical protein [Capnocytophaga sp.]MDO5106631.1 hypothetical protein [Capnocytophaga sp.]